MKRITTLLLIGLLPILATGCSMCCGPFDYDYPTFGGLNQRVDPRYGRVGSIFSDPNAGFSGPSADSNLEQPPGFEKRSSDGDDDPDMDLDDMVDPTETDDAMPLQRPDVDDDTAFRQNRLRRIR